MSSCRTQNYLRPAPETELLIRFQGRGVSSFAYDMKTFNRMALGVASSVLLSAGFSRAAQRLDPLTKLVGRSSSGDSSGEASACSCACQCTMPCMHEAKSV